MSKAASGLGALRNHKLRFYGAIALFWVVIVFLQWLELNSNPAQFKYLHTSILVAAFGLRYCLLQASKDDFYRILYSKQIVKADE